MTRVIAIDPATITGAAFTDGTRTVCETWKLTSGDHGQAILDLGANLRLFIDEHGCNRLVCEDASFGSNNRATAAFHNALRGAIESIAAELGLPPVWKYNPSSLKKETTGNGKATKEQMIAAVKFRYGVVCANDNEADAAAMAHLAVQAIAPIGMQKRALKKRIKKLAKRQAKMF